VVEDHVAAGGAEVDGAGTRAAATLPETHIAADDVVFPGERNLVVHHANAAARRGLPGDGEVIRAGHRAGERDVTADVKHNDAIGLADGVPERTGPAIGEVGDVIHRAAASAGGVFAVTEGAGKSQLLAVSGRQAGQAGQQAGHNFVAGRNDRVFFHKFHGLIIGSRFNALLHWCVSFLRPSWLAAAPGVGNASPVKTTTLSGHVLGVTLIHAQSGGQTGQIILKTFEVIVTERVQPIRAAARMVQPAYRSQAGKPMATRQPEWPDAPGFANAPGPEKRVFPFRPASRRTAPASGRCPPKPF